MATLGFFLNSFLRLPLGQHPQGTLGLGFRVWGSTALGGWEMSCFVYALKKASCNKTEQPAVGAS